MKKILSIVLTGLILVTFSSCTKWLDINDDPNNPTSASPELVLPVAELSVAVQVGGYYNLLGGFWSQYWTQSSAANQYKYIDSYTINATDFSSQWTELYAGALNDLYYVSSEAEASEDWSIYLIATCLRVYTFQVLSDLYDQIPYSEATLGAEGNFNPVYESGQTVYDGLIARLDTALSKNYKLTERELPTDYLFNGDMDSWVKFANTLKLKIYIRQTEARPAIAQAGIEKLYTDGAEFLDTDAGLDIFEDAIYKDNPLYAANVRNLNVATNLRASATFFIYLNEMSDSRFDYYFTNGGTTTPLPQGGFNISSTVIDPTTVTVFSLYPTTPVNLISLAESKFWQAEVAARGWGATGAEALYKEGVAAAFAQCGLAGDDVTYTDAGGVYEYPDGTLEENLKAIMMQKWISLAGTNGIESFFETNRTGYPEISSIEAWEGNAFNSSYLGGEFTYSLEGVTGAGNFPKRLLVPQTERASNINVPEELMSKVVTDKVWWAK